MTLDKVAKALDFKNFKITVNLRKVNWEQHLHEKYLFKDDKIDIRTTSFDFVLVLSLTLNKYFPTRQTLLLLLKTKKSPWAFFFPFYLPQ